MLALDIPHEFSRLKDALTLATRLTPLKAGVVVYSKSNDLIGDARDGLEIFYEAGRIRWTSISQPTERSQTCVTSQSNGASPRRPS